MKSPLNYIHNYPHRTKQILGISYEQFQQLVIQAKLRHEQQLAAIEKSKIRVNAKGAGRQPILSLEAQICLSLFYLRHLPTFEVLGLHFGISKTEANDTFHYWLDIWRELLPASLLEQVEYLSSDSEVVREILTEFELLVDSTEQARERPGENQEQREYYSGKKKNHTFKNQVITLPKGADIVDVEVGEKGPTSDIALFRQQQQKFADTQGFSGDKAYAGAKRTTTPHKKPRKGELTAEQLSDNKIISSQRIFIEHVIRLLKIFRVAKERFRLHPSSYKQVILTICGLVRLRIGTLILSV